MVARALNAGVQLGWAITLDRSGQVLRLDAPKDVAYEWRNEPSHVEQREDPLSPTLPPATGDFVPAALLAQKAKQFDDGLYAAVELAATNGAGAFPGIHRFLVDLVQDMRKGGDLRREDPTWLVLAANELGQGWGPGRVPHLGGRLGEILDAFEADARRSKPLGFYTWSQPLRWSFRRDRMLQSAIPAGANLARLLSPLRSDPARRATYTAWLALAEGMTNPFAYADLRPLLGGQATRSGTAVRFLPPSRSKESDLAKRLWGDRPVPDGANLLDLLIQRVRDGSVSLEPRDDSGWYDRQTWSLEPLLRPEATPEAAHLRYSKAYRKHLEDLFRGILALTRETHVKQLESPAAGAYMPPPTVHIRPELTVEPLATSYRRRADSYAFVRGVLERAFGRGALGALHRETAGGPVSMDLDTELAFMERLFREPPQRPRPRSAPRLPPIPGPPRATWRPSRRGGRCGRATPTWPRMRA